MAEEATMSHLDTKTPQALAEDLQPLVQRAHQGDATALASLRQLLANRPELWQRFGDLAWHAEEALLQLAAGPSLLAKEALQRRMAELREELAGPAPTPVEKMLVDRVVLGWAEVHLADLDALQGDKAGPRAAHALKRQNAAQKRYLAALKQLTQVRKLLKREAAPLDLGLFSID
jgi:hypothetical protein